MNTIFKYILLFVFGLTVVSCSKSDSNSTPLRDYSEQYAKDLTNIETYLHTHYIEVVNNPGSQDDQDVTFTKIPDGGTQTSIWDQTTYPLQTREVTVTQNGDEITYKIYYLKLREGSGQSPCNVDRVLSAYHGEYIYAATETTGGPEVIKSIEFEESNNPQVFFDLTAVIRGWSEIFPQFKTGTYTSNPDGTVSYNDFGAGVMFIPSGLAYFSGAQGGIPSYSPLIFSFKFYELQRADQDGDGIYSYLEDLNGDGYVYKLGEGVVNPDNTNAPGTAILIAPDRYSEEDEVPDFLDTDDDGDFFSTKSETKYVDPADLSGTARYYPYDGVATDDPSTPYVDETKGVPDCSGDYTSPTRIRKYLDPTCH